MTLNEALNEAARCYDELAADALADAERFLRDEDTDEDLAAQVLQSQRAAWNEGRQRNLDQLRKAIEAGEDGTMRRATHAGLTPSN